MFILKFILIEIESFKNFVLIFINIINNITFIIIIIFDFNKF